MKAKSFLILCLLYLPLIGLWSQETSKSTNRAETIIINSADSITYELCGNFFAGVSKDFVINWKIHDIADVTCKNGIIRHVKDSLYVVTPQKKGLLEIRMGGWVFVSDVNELPEPDIFCLKGFPYSSSPEVLSDRMRGITIDNLLRYNRIEGRHLGNIYKVTEFQCILWEAGSSRVFKSDTISPEFIRSLKTGHHGILMGIGNVKLLAPDSTEMEINRTDIFLADIYNDSTDMLINRYLANHVGPGKKTKADIRIRVEGNPGEEDMKTIMEVVDELNSLQRKIKVKLVRWRPSLTILIDSDGRGDSRNSETHTMWSKGRNPFFKLLSEKEIFASTKYTDQSERNLFLWKEISRSLCEFDYNNSDRSVISTIIGRNSVPGLTNEDKLAIRAIFAPGADKVIKEIMEEKVETPGVIILLSIVLTIVLFFVFYEIDNYFNLTGNIRNKTIRMVVTGLLISHMAIAVYYSLICLIPSEIVPLIYIVSLEIYLCCFTIIACILLRLAVLLSEKIQVKWLGLALNPVMTITSLYLAYQFVYLFVRAEPLHLMTISTDAITIALSVTVVRFFMQYEKTRITSLIEEKEHELTKQRELTNRADLNALQARINPHFLYNALNSIAALAPVDSKRTENMALSLSKLFRYTLNRKDDVNSTIGKEIEIAELYLEIEKQRFIERLNYSIDADDNVKKKVIPRLLLQPLVENAVKHGISKITGQGIIKIKVFEKENFLIIEVYDNGPEFPEGLLSGYGLQNTYDKLSLVYRRPYEVRFINKPFKYIQITLR